MPVYSTSYKPSRDSYTGGKIRARGTELRLFDNSLDGGVGILLDGRRSGRTVDPDSMPTKIYWASNRKTQDYKSLFVRTVSERFKILIEEIEPKVHQFVPLEFVRKSGDLLENRWFWQIRNRIDSVFTDRPGWVFDRVLWRRPAGDTLIFQDNKIGDTHFWHEKHLLSDIFMSEFAMARLNEEDISGFKMTEYATV